MTRLIRSIVLVLVAATGLFALLNAATRREPPESRRGQRNHGQSAATEIVQSINTLLAETWAKHDLQPAPQTDDLTILRRLSLALHGTIPSLEEIREFRQAPTDGRIERWTSRMLADRRFADYMAERLARSLVGTEDGNFFLYRRDQFTLWLSDQLHSNSPYDVIVRRILAASGLWTGQPATNFIMSAYANQDLDENQLAGRTVRAFLGQRVDCAQCHDHPFDPSWKQSDFEGLAAFFGQTRLTIVGVEDIQRIKGRTLEYSVAEDDSEDERTIAPRVPFGKDFLPDHGSRRSRLAGWITHPENRRFERATANRVWALMFGIPFHEPVDDLPHPAADSDILDRLGHDFRSHQCDIKRLFTVVTRTQAFRCDSRSPDLNGPEYDQHVAHWALFPLSRLRPEQLIGAAFQASSVQTVDRDSHPLIRLQRATQERNFIRDHGDSGIDEFEARSGTIPQTLLRMNGQLFSEASKPDGFRAVSSIADFSESSLDGIEASFLTCLTRIPSSQERQQLLNELDSLQQESERKRFFQDLFWALLNSPEFAWSH